MEKMSSKLRKAIGAVKDCASIGLAKVSRGVLIDGTSTSHIDVLVLQATTHDDRSIDIRRIDDVVLLSSASSSNIAACASAISRRLDRTHNWIVALKCLHLAHLLIRHDHGDFFVRDAFFGLQRSLCDEYTGKNPWDYGAFVHAFAIYLSFRICTPILNFPHVHGNELDLTRLEALRERIGHWQDLLHVAIKMTPVGMAKRNPLVHSSLQEVVCESFEIHGKVKEGLGVLLERFVDMKRKERVVVYRTCERASRQAIELVEFYESCKGFTRAGEFLPQVAGVPAEVLTNLDELLRREETTAGATNRRKYRVRFAVD